MNLSITIPLLFYDLIARVFPGFFFISTLRLVLSGTSVYADFFPDLDKATGAIDQALSGVGTAVVSYFAGWVLRGVTFRSAAELAKPDELTNWRYQAIRLRDPEAGFRIVKLRAEARMLEASRTAMLIVMAVVLLTLVLRLFGPVTATRDDPLAWLVRFILPGALLATFWKLEVPHWKLYYGNIAIIHELLDQNRSSSNSGEESTQQGSRPGHASP